jgi:hypothetical protein
MKPDDRVRYTISSGFCSQVYYGTVIKLNERTAKIRWKDNAISRAELQYLTIITEEEWHQES